MSLTSFPRTRLFNFIRKRSGPFDDEVVLDSSRVYILPSRTGLLFCLLLLLLLVGSVNYEKSLGYALTFLLAGVANVGILSTWKNLKGLVVRAGGSAPVFAGESARFIVRCSDVDGQARYAIAVSHSDQEYDLADVAGAESASLHFDVPAVSRGLMSAGPCKLSTEFPFGLFVAWTWVDLNMQCLVYPAPAEQVPDILSSGEDGSDGESAGDGMDVFEGLRSYQTGESYKRVSWKAFARNAELMIKQYSGGSPLEQWIDWSSVPATGIEDRLSILCRMVLEAEKLGVHYGLRLPGKEIAPAGGLPHRHRCLRELALYGVRPDAN